MNRKKPNYITCLFIVFSQTINTAFFLGYPDEMLSARCERNHNKPFWNKLRIILNNIFFWQDDHCKETFEWELSKKDMPDDYS